MPSFMNSIPGGPDTQIADEAGNPEYVGLSPQQAEDSRSMIERSIARGPDQLRHQQDLAEQPTIPTGLEEGMPAEAPQEPQQGAATPLHPNTQPDEPRKIVTVRKPGGEVVDVRVPQSFDGQDIKNFLIDRGVPGFKPDGDAVDRLVYGFRQEGNIMTQANDYLISMWPVFAMENVWNPETNRFDTIDAEDRFGADFMQLTPQQRRERMIQVKAQKLKEDYPEIHPKNLGTAGAIGGVAKAVADPVALLPGGAAVKAGMGARTAWQGVKQIAPRASAAGAAWGGGYELTKHASEEGLPTTMEEATRAGKKVAEGAAIGAAGGAVIGGAGGAIAGRVGGRAHRKLMDVEKAGEFSRKQYWPQFWAMQSQGMSADDAARALRKKYNIDMDDQWRIQESIKDMDRIELAAVRGKKDEYVAARDLAELTDDELLEYMNIRMEAKKNGTGTYAPATDAADASERMYRAAANRFGDPILLANKGEYAERLLRPIAGVVKDISPRIYKKLTDMEGNVPRLAHEYHQEFKLFHKEARTLQKNLPEAQAERFARHLFNGETKAARTIWQRAGMDKTAFDKMEQGLLRLREDFRKAGIPLDEISGYFPRIVKDVDGLREAIKRDPKLAGIEAALAKAEKVKKRPLSENEATDVINNWLEGAILRKKKIKQTVTSEKKRGIKRIPQSLVKFYHDPATSLEYHLREAVSKVERAKFFGGALKSKHGVDDITESVGALMKQEGITGKAATRLQGVLESRFGMGERTGRPFFASARSITGGYTLGNPLSAIRQFGDIPSVMMTQGVTNTLVSMFRKNSKEMNADAFGYMLEMAQELDTQGLSTMVRKASQGMYQLGFKQVDRYSKNVLIKAAHRNAMKSMKTAAKAQKFRNKYASMYDPEDMAKLMDDLKNGRVTELVKLHVNAEVMRIQPISRSRMPQMYLDMPNGRLFYQFRTWGLNQLELFREEVWRGLKSSNKGERRRAARNAVLWLAGVGTTNTAITQAQRWITGRDLVPSEELPDEIVWQTIGNFGLLNRYSVEQATKRADINEIGKSFLPPSYSILGGLFWKAGLVGTGQTEADTDSMRDILKTGGIGRLIDWWALGGAEEYNEKLQKRLAQEGKSPLGGAYAQ